MHEELIQDLLDMAELHTSGSHLKALLLESAHALSQVTQNAPERAKSARAQLEDALSRQRKWKSGR